LKIIHTSDWHLGKKLYKKDRLPEQKLFLDWLMSEIAKQQAELLIISGDIFDTPMPPTEALSIFFNFLKALETVSFIHQQSLQKVIIIGGNHDGAKLLEAPRPFLDNDLVTILGRPKPPTDNSKEALAKWKDQNSITIKDKLLVGLLPYFRVGDFIDSPLKRNIESYSDLSPQDQIIAQLNEWSIKMLEANNLPSVMVGHHLFGSFMPGGSEQGVSLSGLDTIPLSLFKNWDVLMLGHIHKAQLLKKEKPLAVYSGSPLPMRFSEKNQKNIYLYEIENKDKINFNPIEIPIFRPLIKINSTPETWLDELLKEIKEWSPSENPLSAYVEISINFKKYKANYIDHIRDQIKDLPVELLNFFALYEDNEEQEDTLKADTVKNSTITELFDIYLEQRGVTKEEQKKLTRSFQDILLDRNTEDEDVK
jgi:exonuclease SbcD